MRIIQTADYSELSHTAAILILNELLEKPEFVLGLATGHTPSGLYRELVSTHQELGIDISRLHCFHLDEYLGLTPDELQENLQLLNPVLQVLDKGTLDRDDFTNVYIDSLCRLSDVLDNQPAAADCDAAGAVGFGQ